MKALQFTKTSTPLSVVDVSEPKFEKGTAIVKLLASHVISFTRNVFNGNLGYMFPQTDAFTPGATAVGIVEQCDETNGVVKNGDKVFFDNYIYHKNSLSRDEAILMGWTGLGKNAPLAQQRWPNGSWSEKFICPVDQLHVVPSFEAYSPHQWAVLNCLNISYGALVRAEFKPGMKVVINGATGGLGSGTVLLALALGASKIVAVGRKESSLLKLKNLSPDKIETVNSGADYDTYSTQIKNITGGTDVVIDAMGEAKTAEPSLACIRSLRHRGIAVFIGSVVAPLGLQSREIFLPEIELRGSFMYEPQAPAEMIRLVHAGIVDLNKVSIEQFSFANITEAMDYAAQAQALEFAVLTP